MLNVISHGGYYSSGGSVVRDVYKEFDPVFEFPSEFRLLKERFGLFDLEYALLNTGSPEIVDLAIRDFLWLTINFARNATKFSKIGMSYDKKTNEVFMSATKDFIEELVDYKYPMDWHFYQFKKNYFSQIKSKIEKKFFTKNIRTQEGKTSAFMSFPDQEKYFEASKRYLKNVLDGFRTLNNLDTNSIITLHNAIPPYSTKFIERGSRYFDQCKVVIVDRDPRDIFLNYPKDSYGRYISTTDSIHKKAQGFIHFYKSIRKYQDEVRSKSNVLFLRFEDCVINYDEYLNRLYSFSNLNSDLHKNKGTIFKPELSIKNIGMWKDSKGDMLRAIDLIERELTQYLYDIN